MPDVLVWILLGVIAGSVAKGLLSEGEPKSWWATILLGIAGAFVGGFIGIFLPFLKDGVDASLGISSVFTATIGSILILAVYRRMKTA